MRGHIRGTSLLVVGCTSKKVFCQSGSTFTGGLKRVFVQDELGRSTWGGESGGVIYMSHSELLACCPEVVVGEGNSFVDIPGKNIPHII